MGIKRERFVSVVDNYICSVCKDVYLEPYQCSNGHRFCRTCITSHVQQHCTCPVDDKPQLIESLKVGSKLLASIMNVLKIRCENYGSNRCPDVMRLDVLDDHQLDCSFKRQDEVIAQHEDLDMVVLDTEVLDTEDSRVAKLQQLVARLSKANTDSDALFNRLSDQVDTLRSKLMIKEDQLKVVRSLFEESVVLMVSSFSQQLTTVLENRAKLSKAEDMCRMVQIKVDAEQLMHKVDTLRNRIEMVRGEQANNGGRGTRKCVTFSRTGDQVKYFDETVAVGHANAPI